MEAINESNESYLKQIREYLQKEGATLTKLQALRMFGCWNTGHIIYKLRKSPYDMPIETKMIEKNGKRFAEYSLKQS